jgi:hypothetical protein
MLTLKFSRSKRGRSPATDDFLAAPDFETLIPISPSGICKNHNHMKIPQQLQKEVRETITYGSQLLSISIQRRAKNVLKNILKP